MSTAVADKPAEKKDVDKLVQCPRCEAIYHESELVIPRHDEYPRMVYKAHPKEDPKAAAEPEPPPDTKVVNSEDELKKAEGEGWSKDVPKPKDAKAQHEPNAKVEPHKVK